MSSSGRLVERIRKALRKYDVRVQRRVTCDGVSCSGLFKPDEGVILLSLSECRNADELVLTLLHEAAHDLDLPEYLVGGALEKALFRSPTLRWEAARVIINSLIGAGDAADEEGS